MHGTRQDLPDLSSDYPLTLEQIADFQRDGHVLLHGVCAPRRPRLIAGSSPHVAYQHNTNTLPMEERSTYAKAFIQIGQCVAEEAEALRRYVLARRFAEGARGRS